MAYLFDDFADRALVLVWLCGWAFGEVFAAHELPDAEKVPLLRAYLRRWAFEVNQFFQGVGADAPDAELQRIAPGYPIFRIE